MTLLKFLKTANARVSVGGRWLYWDETSNEWVVAERRYGAKKNTTLFRGSSLEAALNVLE